MLGAEYLVCLGTFLAIHATGIEVGMVVGVLLAMVCFVVAYAQVRERHAVDCLNNLLSVNLALLLHHRLTPGDLSGNQRSRGRWGSLAGTQVQHSRQVIGRSVSCRACAIITSLPHHMPSRSVNRTRFLLHIFTIYHSRPNPLVHPLDVPLTHPIDLH